jgi:hypothetical protein
MVNGAGENGEIKGTEYGAKIVVLNHMLASYCIPSATSSRKWRSSGCNQNIDPMDRQRLDPDTTPDTETP